MRLLTVDPSTSGTGVDCILRNESLDCMCPYQALSYTWGEEAPSNMIWGNSQPTLARQNRELLLQYMGNRDGATSIWADAMCINQKDKQGKIKQVHMIGKVNPGIGKKAIAAGIQDCIEKRAKEGGKRDSRSKMISSSLAKGLHQIRPTYIEEAFENIADYEMVTSDSDRDNDVQKWEDFCGGLNQAWEVIRSKSDRLTRASSSYTEVAVLLLSWNDHDQGVQNEVSDLKTRLEELNFHVEESSAQELQKKVFESLDLLRSEADLLIIYDCCHDKVDNPRYGRRIWRVSGLSGVEKDDIENGGRHGHGHKGPRDGFPTLEGPDIEKQGKHVFSSYRSGNPVSEDAPFGERLDTWTRIKAHMSQLQTWVDPSTTFRKRNSREKSPGWTLGYGRSRPWRDTDTSAQCFSRIDRVCLGLNPIIYSPLVWTLLRSLHLEPPSLLDRKLQRLLPFASNAIIALEDYPRAALILVVHLLSLSVVVILKPAASMNGRTNLCVCPCWILVLTCGLLSWPLMGGSLLEFCLLFVPFALSVGMTLGLLIEHLWQLRLGRQPRGSRRHHLVLANHSAEKM